MATMARPSAAPGVAYIARMKPLRGYPIRRVSFKGKRGYWFLEPGRYDPVTKDTNAYGPIFFPTLAALWRFVANLDHGYGVQFAYDAALGFGYSGPWPERRQTGYCPSCHVTLPDHRSGCDHLRCQFGTPHHRGSCQWVKE